MNDIVFAIDPGSIRSGWCVMKPPEQLVEAGLLLPNKLRALPEFRINDQCESLRELLNKWQPKTILLEWTSGKVGRKRHRGQGAGLAIYGISVGSLWQVVLAWRRALPAKQQLEVKVELILENLWCRQIPKSERIATVAATFPEYNASQDPGGDIADALGLAVWYLRERVVKLVECLK